MSNSSSEENVDRLTARAISNSAKSLWRNQPEVARKIALQTENIILQIQKKGEFLAGRTMKGVLGGLFYLLGFRYDNMKTQKEIAASLKTNEVTIRLSYRRWLCRFPDLFTDVVEKMKECSFLHDFSLYK